MSQFFEHPGGLWNVDRVTIKGGTNSYLRLGPMTTAERDTFDPENGMYIYNTTLSVPQLYNGGWISIGGGGGDVTAAAVMTDNSIVRGDGGGKGVQDTGVLIDDNDVMSGLKGIYYTAEAELTLDGAGAITVTQTRHKVDTNADAASGDLVTINGGGTVNLIIIRAEADARTIVVKHNTGNIWLQGKADISLDDIEDGIMLAWDSTNSKWFDIAAGGGGGGGGGDVAGPGSSTDNAVARFDSTTGKLLQNSVVIIADTTGNITGVGSLALGDVLTFSDGATIDNTDADTLTITETNVVIAGNLDVTGTTTTINSTTLQVDDKNIELGTVAVPDDTTADGGGITLKGTTDKTIIWDNANDNWTFNQSVNIATGLDFKVNNVSVLNATTLGSAVVSSSLTSVGTIGTGVWQGTVIDHERGGLEADVSAYSGFVYITGGTTSARASGIADTNVVVIHGADIASGEFARFTASGLESRTAAEVLSDLGLGTADSVQFAGLTVTTIQANGAITVGVDDTGHDVKLHGATAGAYFLFDESEDAVALVGGATKQMELRFYEDTDNGANYVALKAPDTLAGSITLTLPVNIENGKVLQTDAAGQLSWATLSGGGDVLADGSVPFTATVSIEEVAAAAADVAGTGQVWVKTGTPNTLWFTDDAGTDFQLGVGGGGFVDISGTPEANDFARFTDADTVEGLSYSEVRSALGLVIGTNVQAYDAELAALAALTFADDQIIIGTGAGTIAMASCTVFAQSILDDADEATFKATVNLEIGTDVLAYDAGLANLATVAMVADRFYYTTADNTHAAAAVTTFARSILDDSDEATFKATVNLEIGTDVLAYDAGLANLAAVGMVADRFYYTSADNVHVAGTVTTFARSILDDANEATFKATVNLEIGTDVQAFHANLTDIAGLTFADDQIIIGTGAGTIAMASCTAFAQTILDDADQAAVQATLALVPGTNVQAYSAELLALGGLTSAANKIPYFTAADTAGMLDFKDEDTMSSDSATALASQQSIKKYVDDNAGAAQSAQSAKAIQSSAYDTSTGTVATIPWGAEEWDTDSLHDNSTTNSRLTCKRAGKYFVALQVVWESNNTGIRQLVIDPSAAGVANFQQIFANTASGQDQCMIYGLLEMAVNDYVEAKVYQNSGGNLEINVSGSSFAMFEIP